MTPADVGRDRYLRITGQIQAPSHKFAPRRCRSGRVLDIESPSLAGAMLEIGSTYPTTKTGRFRVEFTLDYGTGKLKVQKVKGDPFRTYTCRRLRLTIQFAAPPAPGI